MYKNDSYCLNLERKQSSNKINIYIIITIVVILVIILLVISIFLYKGYIRKTEEQKLPNKREETKDEKLINEIYSDLLPSNN